MFTSKTGVTYHEDMAKHLCLWDAEFPECPARYTQVLKRCTELGLIDRCETITAREATSDEILSKHTSESINLLQQCQTKNAEELEEICSRYDSIYICSQTYRAAKLAAGSVINLVKEICDGRIENGMAIVRPPGHHAMKSTYCGYCFFNNVALAADYALKNCNISRILIVDWDVHHGQATQQMFYDDKRVLYFSIHRFEYGTFWPNLRESDYDHVGVGEGKGYNFNVPLNKTGMGNAEYLAIFNELLLPVAAEYDPELIIVSCGYDAAIGCPEGEMKVEPACYAHLIHSLAQLAGRRVAVVLEGGYFLKSLAEGAALTLRALLGDPCPKIDATVVPDEIMRETIRNVIWSHRDTWNCFKIYDTVEPTLQNLACCHNPLIRFEYDEEPLLVFPTRGAYPVRTKDMEDYYNDWLDDLIDGTDLQTAKYKCLFISDQMTSDKIIDYVIRDFNTRNGGNTGEKFSEFIKVNNIEWENEIFDWEKNSFVVASLLRASRYLHENLAGSVVLERSGYIDDFLRAEALAKYGKNNKTLVINLNCETKQIRKAMENILCFTICNGAAECGTDEKYTISVDWQNAAVGNFEYFTLWTKTVLPICYEFAPDIILILIDLDNLQKNNVTAELPSHLIHWTKALARGRITVVVKKSESEFAEMAFTCVCKSLAGERLPNLRMNNFTKHGVDAIKELNGKLESKWPCLNSFVKFPSEKIVL